MHVGNVLIWSIEFFLNISYHTSDYAFSFSIKYKMLHYLEVKH